MRPLSETGNYISTRIGRAIQDYNLIEDKDRILVAVSGGKDSMSLLKLLVARKAWAPVDFELIAMHVETDFKCGGCAQSKVLKAFFKENGVKCHFEKIKVYDKKKKKTSCFWCSWNRRKALFLAADKFGCNKVALGHHRDDIVETLLLNLFFHGEFAAMNPRQELFGGKLSIIRPLCYVEEEYMRKFAKELHLPTHVCRCPNLKTSKRRFMKNLVKIVEKECAYAKMNVFKSMARVNKEYLQFEHEDHSEVEKGKRY